jgi:hypothetical protein
VTATGFTVSAGMLGGTTTTLDGTDGRVRRSDNPLTTLLRLRAVG